MTKVSIIVPIYNTTKYLKNCIDSLINQTLKEIEIILINDGSTENVNEIINLYHDKRIKYIDKVNEGIGKTRNLGIKQSSGEYIMFIDSDDYIETSCAKSLYDNAVKNNSDLVVSNYIEDREEIVIKKDIYSFGVSNIDKDNNLLYKLNLGPCNKLYKRSLLVDNNIYFEEKLKYEDAPFVIKSIYYAKTISKEESYLSHYIIHSNSQTTTRDRKIFDILKITDIIKETIDIKYREALTNLIVMILTDYTIQTRYIEDKKIRNEFISEAFKRLDTFNSDWKKCIYLKEFSWIKRVFKTNKLLTIIYTSIYRLKKC